MAADENIRSVWTNEETVTFLKLVHETQINALFPSCFLIFSGLTGALLIYHLVTPSSSTVI